MGTQCLEATEERTNKTALGFSQTVWLIPSQQNDFFFLAQSVREARPTFQDFLQVLLGEDGAARVGWVGDDQAGSPLVNQALQMLQVDLPGLLGLQEQTCASAESHFMEIISLTSTEALRDTT